MRRKEWKFRVSREKESEIEEFLAEKETNAFYFETSPSAVESTLHLYDENVAKEIEKRFLISGEASSFDDEDWIEVWRKSLKLLELEDNFYINPDPERICTPKNGITVFVKPGMAFGTGEHETTKLAAKLLIETMKEKKFPTVCDVGCGTGVLSALACKLGAQRVLAVDIDENALKQAKETASLNNVNYEVRKSDLLNDVNENFDLYMANIVFDVLKELIEEIPSDATFIASGINVEKSEPFKKLCERFNIIEERREGKWCAFLIET